MFKAFFGWISAKLKNIWSKFKSSKTVKTCKKIGSAICKGSVVLSAFNTGNIMESVHNITNEPTNIIDTFKWIIIMSHDWINNVKTRNFTWDTKFIFIPMVISAGYIAYKAISTIFKIVKNHKIVETNCEESNATPVVDVFA